MTQARDPSELYKERELTQIKDLIKTYKEAYKKVSDRAEIELEKQKAQMNRERVLSFKQQLFQYETQIKSAFHLLQSRSENISEKGFDMSAHSANILNQIMQANEKLEQIQQQIDLTEKDCLYYEAQIQKQEEAAKRLENQYIGSISILNNSLAKLSEEGISQTERNLALKNTQVQEQAVKEKKNALDFSKVDVAETKEILSSSIEKSKNILGNQGSEIKNLLKAGDLIKKIREIFLEIDLLKESDNQDDKLLRMSNLNDMLRDEDSSILDIQIKNSNRLTTVRSEIEIALESALNQQRGVENQNETQNQTVLSQDHSKDMASTLSIADVAEIKNQKKQLEENQNVHRSQMELNQIQKNKPILDAFLKVLQNEIERIKQGHAIHKGKKTQNIESLIKAVKSLEAKENLDLKSEFEHWKQDPNSAYSKVIHRSHLVHQFFQMKNQSEYNIEKFFDKTYPKLAFDLENAPAEEMSSPKLR